jgi:hypothetical protein
MAELWQEQIKSVGADKILFAASNSGGMECCSATPKVKNRKTGNRKSPKSQ